MHVEKERNKCTSNAGQIKQTIRCGFIFVEWKSPLRLKIV